MKKVIRHLKQSNRKVSTSAIMSALCAVGIAAAIPSAQAQEPTTATVIGIVDEGATCELILDIEGSNGSAAVPASDEVCTQALAGQRIQYTPQIMQITTIAPPREGNVVLAEAGDRICYVRIQAENGQTTEHFAGFEICGQNIEGEQVRLTYGTGNILDYSCFGDVDCGRSDAAELIVKAEVIPQPEPTRQPIGSLPDGNYRYWSGPTQAFASNEDIAENRGFLFLFQKRGNNITGVYGYYDDIALCVQGQVNDDTVTGISVENNPGARVLSAGESFTRVYPFSDSMQVRRGQQINADTVRHSSTLLDLTGLNRINAGSRLPPSRC